MSRGFREFAYYWLFPYKCMLCIFIDIKNISDNKNLCHIITSSIIKDLFNDFVFLFVEKIIFYKWLHNFIGINYNFR